MPTFNKNILELARENRFFCLEIVTNEFSQVLLMSIEPGGDIGEAVYEGDHVLVIIEGSGEAVLNRRHTAVQAGSMVAVPAGTRHNIINTGATALKLFTVYAPPQAAPHTLYQTRAEADAAEDEEDEEQRMNLIASLDFSSRMNETRLGVNYDTTR